MKKIIFLILLISFCNFLLLPQQASAQDTTKTKEKRKNNTIKGIIGIDPFSFSGIASLGYERYISANSSLNITANVLLADNGGYGGESSSSTESIILSYNYYIISRDRIINNFWFGTYLLGMKTSGSDEYRESKENGYGIGLYLGKRMYFSHIKKRMFFDIGLGISYNYFKYTYYYSSMYNDSTGQFIINTELPKPYYSLYPRPILLLGYRF